jgi:ATP-dependent DNA ligase
LEGIVSKRADAPYVPGNRGLWVKVKCLNRKEFVVVGWTDPEGARPWPRSLLTATNLPCCGLAMKITRRTSGSV